MKLDDFKRGKEIIKAGWAEDRIIEETNTKIVLQCENGDYLICRFIESSGIPEIDIHTANKMMIQYTKDLNSRCFDNISKEAFGLREPRNERIREVLQEFALRVKVGRLYWYE